MISMRGDSRFPLRSPSVPQAPRRPAVFLALAALALLLRPASAPASELRLWPLVDYESRAGSARLRLLGPLVEWTRERERSTFSLRPLLRIEREDGRTEGSLLYPVATWSRTPDDFFVRLFGLASYQRSARSSEPSPWTRELTVFPLVFYRESPATGRSLSVLPLYADLPGFAGYERIRMALFPLWLRLEEPLERRTWLPFPFVSVAGGTLGRGFRLWPLWGHTAVGGESETRFVAWPFWIRHVEHPGQAGAVTTRISWPLFSLIDGPRVTSRTWGYLLVIPLYTHTIDREAGTATTGFPWPFWTTQRSLATGELLSARFTPFWQDRRTESLRSRFVMWPFWRHREGLGESAGYERTDVFFFVWRDQSEKDGARRLRVLFPFWRSETSPDDADAQALTFLDGIFPRNEDLRAVWAPLWRLWGTSGRGAEARHELLWGLAGWHGGRFRPPLSLSPD